MQVMVLDDLNLATYLLTHPAIWPALVNDDAPEIGVFRAPPNFAYLLATDGDEPAGLFGLRPDGDDLLMHAAMLPEYRGRGTLKAVDQVLQKVWSETQAQRVRVRFEAWNTKARAAAVRAGFKECGRMPDAVRRCGRLVDLIEMEVCRELHC